MCILFSFKRKDSIKLDRMKSLSVLQVLKLIKECFEHANESVDWQRLVNPFASAIAKISRSMIHSIQNPFSR